MKLRTFLAASAAGLAMPAVSRAQASRVLKFIPQADLTVLDPVWTTAYVTRNHGFMVYDTLYGQDSTYKVSPQMTMVMRGALWQILIGLALGIPAALYAGYLMKSLLYEVQSYDVVALAGAPLLLVACAVLAGFIPARRAASIEPMQALRTE